MGQPLWCIKGSRGIALQTINSRDGSDQNVLSTSENAVVSAVPF